MAAALYLLPKATAEWNSRELNQLITYLCHQHHCYTIGEWLRDFTVSQRGEIRVLPYQHIRGFLSTGTYIFSDIERLDRKLTDKALRLYDKARLSGSKILNHPSASLKRYALQKALNNDFVVYRSTEIAKGAQPRYPVFLREENGHTGALTPLLHSRKELIQALARYPDALVVEFLDTAGADGLYRKYSALCVGGTIIPWHEMLSTQWEVKDAACDQFNESSNAEEYAYVSGNPHRNELKSIFAKANIQYGRIDYSLLDQRIQVWEINTNPHIKSGTWEHYPIRIPVVDLITERLNASLLDLARKGGALPQKKFWCGLGPRKLHKPRFIDPLSKILAS